jgi:hypothetical protein
MNLSTRYQKSIKKPEDYNILKQGSNNKKLGWTVKAKQWKGKKIYSLTLVERETCPRSCHHWDDCYGNNMPFAHRFDTEGLMDKLEQEIPALLDKHKLGIVIRLHVLGDFYSTEYVEFWERMLLQYPTLCLFGYTARDDEIGKRISLMNMRLSERCVIRFSRSKEYDSPNRYAAEEGFDGKAFQCPEQNGKMDSCADCGLCWMTTKTVKFASH